ncbi:MAG: acyl-CoA carboxylase subunit beta [Christensenellales bacterium]|jgi:acetyl-CoA carboxylase carboxyltransferase component
MSQDMKLEDLRRRKQEIIDSEKARQTKQKSAGKLTARERVSALLDEGSFIELDAFVESRAAAFSVQPYSGEGVITGYGSINGQKVCVYAQDFSVHGGSMSEMHAAKVEKVIQTAVKCGYPVIALTDTSGARIQEGADAMNGYARILKLTAAASGVVPQIAMVLGPCIGAAAVTAALSDVVIAVDGISEISAASPRVLAATFGEEAKGAGGAAFAADAGIVQMTCGSENEAFKLVQKLISCVPGNNLEDAPDAEGGAASDVDISADTISAVADEGSLIEYMPSYGGSAKAALGRLNGRVTGFIAFSGRLDSASSLKAARFVRFCDSFSIQLVTFTDCEGAAISTDAEKQGLVKDAAKLGYAIGEVTVPIINVICGKAIGLAYVLLSSKGIGNDMVLAWPQAEISTLSAEATVNILMGDKLAASDDSRTERHKLAEEYANTFASPWEAAKRGLVDDVIEPQETREKLIASLGFLEAKRESNPAKKHGNIPL